MRQPRLVRHEQHWRWLTRRGQQRYQRALRLWQALYGVRPSGLVLRPIGQAGLDFVRD